LANLPIDVSVLGKILLSEFDGLNSNKFKLAVIYSMMNGKSCRIYGLNGKVLRLFKNKKGHLSLFKLKVDEAINWLIANRVLLRFGKAFNSLKLCENYLEIFNKLKMDIDCDGAVETKPEKPIYLVDSFAKDKADYLPQDKISNPDEIIWFLKKVLIDIRQIAGTNCKDCNYIKHLSEFVFEHIDPAQLESHVEFNDESFRSLSARLRFLFSKARNVATR
jgi:hypothetical protein